MNYNTTVAGISLEHPLMNAAGTCKLLHDVRPLARSSVAAIMLGSITLEQRLGNEGDVFWYDNFQSLNSLGLPNPGAPYYKDNLPEIAQIAKGEGKPLFVSVAGFTPVEYADLVEIAFEGGAVVVELNLGCPNVWQGGEQKRIASFDPGLSGEVLSVVSKRVGPDAKVAVKVSPCSDPFALAALSDVLNQYALVKCVTTTNTFPNAFLCNEVGHPRITPGGGLAGLAGPALKPIALGQVRQLHAILDSQIQIIGVGGISTGQDIKDFLDSGATVVQVATAYLKHGEQVFTRLLAELIELAE
jgi:dihydroorotate dehydrogenase (fumarate)